MSVSSIITKLKIEKKYDITDADLKKANPDLEKYGLQVGQTLNIPSKNSAVANVVAKSATVYHTVLPKETKFSIAKQYGITIEELPAYYANRTLLGEIIEPEDIASACFALDRKSVV